MTGSDERDNLETLNTVLGRLESVGLTLKKFKCQFGLRSVEYLGHIIDHGPSSNNHVENWAKDVRTYKRTSEQQLEETSDILNRKKYKLCDDDKETVLPRTVTESLPVSLNMGIPAL